MDTRLTPLEKTEKPISITAEVARLARMTVPELRARHEELFGRIFLFGKQVNRRAGY